MSVENVKKFKKDLDESAELKEKIKKELEVYKDSEKDERDLIPEVARKLGYDFTDEEYKEDSKKLSDAELANVSGGAFWQGPDAPDGHEVGCFLCFWEDWNQYYWRYNLCENCQSNNVTWLDRSYKCNICGHKTLAPDYYEDDEECGH